MRYCLIIDDTKQDDEIIEIESLGKNAAFPISCYYFNPTAKECLREETKGDGTKEYLVDLDLVLAELRKRFSKQQLDLIATDYQFSDPLITGMDLVNYLKEQSWKKEAAYIIYSGDAHEIKEKLQSRIKTIVDDREALNSFIEGYYDLNPVRIFKRSTKREDSHIDHIYEFLKKNKTPLNFKLSQKLNQHPERTFENIFPRFEGKPLKVLSELVMRNTEESDSFEDEFLDRCVDHFIELKL